MKGILLFAFNNNKVDYYKMAIATAKRANYFLNLPVSVVTDESTDLTKYDYKFDKTFIQTADKSNIKESNIWINKGRYKAFSLSPYDETIVLDTDYLINSDKLNKIFDTYDDFMCHKSTSFILHTDQTQEQVSPTSFQSLWATVIAFKKTNKVKQIFECLEMVQHNYKHYTNLYNILSPVYRNDYGLTIATRIVHGQSEDPSNYIPWSLVHLTNSISAYRNDSKKFNTEYTLIDTTLSKPAYIQIKDMDFHCLNKQTYMELVDE